MTIGVGVVGMGFMGRRHAANVTALERDGEACRLAAVCSDGVASIGDLTDGNPIGNIDMEAHPRSWSSDLHIAPDYDALLDRDDVHCIIVCTPTPTHVDLAERALQAGKHVLVEKPVALTADGIERLIASHGKTPSLICMPAHVIRFWPGWTHIKDAITDGRFGEVRSATFRRLGSMPDWNPAFYSDLGASGGALVDLHLHDVDFILHCFSEPSAVHATGDLMHVTGAYEYEDGPAHVVAEGAWDQQPGFGFRMHCVVNFERATMEFDSKVDPPLTVIEGDCARSIDESRGDGYRNELLAFLGAVRGERTPPVTLECALRTARVIDRERACLDQNGSDR